MRADPPLYRDLDVVSGWREVGRGGTYTVRHDTGAEEAATGVSLYADALIDDAISERRRLFLPIGTPPEDGRRLRGEG